MHCVTLPLSPRHQKTYPPPPTPILTIIASSFILLRPPTFLLSFRSLPSLRRIEPSTGWGVSASEQQQQCSARPPMRRHCSSAHTLAPQSNLGDNCGVRAEMTCVAGVMYQPYSTAQPLPTSPYLPPTSTNPHSHHHCFLLHPPSSAHLSPFCHFRPLFPKTAISKIA